ncbi:MAG: dithiol-disulfide isomerase [Desulfobacteraceae bacterium]|nr:dithiol-disulfide isomerase [Desulfobacteraceae bacterium]
MTGSIEQLKQEYEIIIKWRAFPLHPNTPEEGLSLEKLFSTNSTAIEKMMNHLKKTAAELGLSIGKREKTYNSRLAQELGLWAESKNRGDEFHLEAFKAYFVDGKNIGKIAVLIDIATSIGLSGNEAKETLNLRKFKTEVDTDWALSREKVITAVPAFVINQDKLIGAQPYEILTKFLDENGVSKRI